MRNATFIVLASLITLMSGAARAAPDPTWWNKYQHILNGNGILPGSSSHSASIGGNVDVSNECGPQSETFITMQDGSRIAGGSNEIFRLPMRAYFSNDGGKTWGADDVPLPPAKGANGLDFGSDPTLAFDTQGNLFYGSIVVFFGAGSGINGTELSVARSTDGGQTWAPSFFGFSGGSNHFNDKPMITTDRSQSSLFRDHVYLAWDAASGGSATGGGVLVATSKDTGASFSTVRADDPNGPGRAIGAVPFTGPNGELYVAWNDFHANTIAFSGTTAVPPSWSIRSSRARAWHLMWEFRRSSAAGRWYTRPATPIGPAVFTAVVFTARGWTSAPWAPASFSRLPIMAASIGRSLSLSAIAWPTRWIASISGSRLTRSRPTSSYRSTIRATI